MTNMTFGSILSSSLNCEQGENTLKYLNETILRICLIQNTQLAKVMQNNLGYHEIVHNYP